MAQSTTRGEALRLLVRPVVVLPVVAGLCVFTFLSLRAPTPPRLVESAPLATQFPTVTPGPSPTFGPPTPTATPAPGAQLRDGLRKDHLAQIAAGLAAYAAARGSYPDSRGNVQPLCVSEAADVGCALRPYVDPAFLKDPIGPYQYVSDGKHWTLFAEFEVIRPGDRCIDPQVQYLPRPERMYCLTGGPAPTSTAHP